MVDKFARLVKLAIVRLYALAILLAVAWCGYAAISYLYVAVFHPALVPERFTGWQPDVSIETLTGGNRPGDRTTDRAPLRHYHGVVATFHPDERNGCTVSGCHGALPHGENKALRAFANMHTTFMTCGTCHARTEGTLEATWMDLATGETREKPAVFELIAVLDSRADDETSDRKSVHDEVVPLLAAVRAVAGSDPVLDHLALALDTSRPGSPVWRHAIAQLAEEAPRHAWGRYGAKIIPSQADARIARRSRELDELTRQYLTASQGGESQQKAWMSIHEQVVFQPAGCLACHNKEQPKMDFESLGYSAAHAEQLGNVANANLMQRLQDGETFHLPRVRGDSDAQ